MKELEKLTNFIESALRHADLPDNPGIASVEVIAGNQGLIGVELADGDTKEFFIEVTPA